MKSCIIVFFVRRQVYVLILAIFKLLLLFAVDVFTRTALALPDILLLFVILVRVLTLADVTILELARSVVLLIVLHIIKN